MATLYVNDATGDDDRDYATAQNSATPWQTIFRAAQGCPPGGTPSGAAAAQPGDVVSVAAGTYSSSAVVNSRSAVLYSPINEGSDGLPIRFVANGVVVLVATSLNGPIIGSNGQDYVEWYADVTQGHRWDITNDGANDPTSTAGTVNIASDTGSVVLWGANHCLIEGVTVDGGGGPFESNYNGVRLESCTFCTVRNNTIHHFSGGSSDNNASGVTIYGGNDNIIEHNDIYDVNSGVVFKDTEATIGPAENNRVRYNLFDNIHLNGVEFSFIGYGVGHVNAEGTNYIYQNIFTNVQSAVQANGINHAGTQGQNWVYNNTFYNIEYGVNQNSTHAGAKVWNNIFSDVDVNMMFSDGGAGEAVAECSYQHNVFHSVAGTFYVCTDGSKSLATWRTDKGQDGDSPQSITSDPLFTNAAGGDFTLQGGSPARDLGRDPDTSATIHAGAYITGDEVIGVDTSGAPVVTPVGGHPVLLLAVL